MRVSISVIRDNEKAVVTGSFGLDQLPEEIREKLRKAEELEALVEAQKLQASKELEDTQAAFQHTIRNLYDHMVICTSICD